jgi:hypothetical protein
MAVSGTEFVELIKSIVPAVMVNHDAELDEEDKAKLPSARIAIWPYCHNAFKNGKEGERFESDFWRNYIGWAVAVPEIIQYQETIYLQCRWWNYIGGLSTGAYFYSFNDVCPDGQIRAGWLIYKQGRGYQSNSQYFVGEDGSVFEYKKEVISHDPVHYKATGGDNVGWTETKISTNLKEVSLESRDLQELFELISNSKQTHERDSLRPIMEGYFKIG